MKIMFFVISIIFNGLFGVHGISTQGKDFFLAFFPNPVGNAPYDRYHNAIFISSFASGSCNVTYDVGIRVGTNLSFNENSFTRHEIPESAMTTIGGKIENKGVHVFCTVDVSVYGYSYYGTVGALTAIPLESLSNEYIFSGTNSNPYMAIIGTADNTNVTIQLKSTCGYTFQQHMYNNGDTINVQLNKNEVFQLSVNTMDYRHYRCDMVGSRIKSTSATAVFSGSIYHQDASSHLVLQVPPPSAFTKLAILPRLVSPEAWKTNVRIVAVSSNTTVHTPHGDRVLNGGEFEDLSFKPNEYVVIQSDKAVMVVENCLFVPDGGFTTFLPGTELYQKEFLLKSLDESTSSEQPEDIVISIISPSESTGDVLVDGSVPSDIEWKKLPSVPYSVAVIQLSDRPTHYLNSTSPIFARLHIFYEKRTHGYVVGYKSGPIKHKVPEVLKLQCLALNFHLSLDLSLLGIDVSDSSNIFLSLDNCTGSVQGTVLTFDIAYDTCGTKAQVHDGKISFRNTLIYAPPSADHVIRHAVWEYDIVCNQ